MEYILYNNRCTHQNVSNHSHYHTFVRIKQRSNNFVIDEYESGKLLNMLLFLWLKIVLFGRSKWLGS